MNRPGYLVYSWVQATTILHAAIPTKITKTQASKMN